MERIYVGGIHGKSSAQSTIVILNSHGKVLCKVDGQCMNPLLVGFAETKKRIADMVVQAKKEAALPPAEPLTALGLSLSGCEQEGTSREIEKGLREEYSRLSERYVIESDTKGSIAATSSVGGVVCIAGTGSNTLLMNPDGSQFQCGGWGYMLSDEGSAWAIALRACKTCFAAQDNYSQPAYPIDRVLNAVKEHFGVTSLLPLLDRFYANFKKSQIAELSKKLSLIARDGDLLSRTFFTEAGEDLARSIGAVGPKASPELIKSIGGLHVVCVGGVWKSFDLLKRGFINYLNKHSDIAELTLVKLTVPMAVGAAYMAADQLRLDLSRSYTTNQQVFFHYKRKCKSCTDSEM